MIGVSSFGRGWGFFSSAPCSYRLWGPLSLLSIEYQGLFPWEKATVMWWPLHSPPSSAEVKNAWSYTSDPQYTFMVWCLVKKEHREDFAFTITGQFFLHLPNSFFYQQAILAAVNNISSYGPRRFTAMTEVPHFTLTW